MDPLFAWTESTALSVWMRDSLWAFPITLIFHTVGLAFLVGVNVGVSARLLGLARAVPLRTLDPFFHVMWLGFWLNAASGVLLLAAYPTKALTNPLFYVKLATIAAGLVTAQAMRAHLRASGPASAQGARGRTLAVVALACWAVGITTGRLLAYTHTRLMWDQAA